MEHRAAETVHGLGALTALLFWCAMVVVSSVYITLPLVSSLAEEYEVTMSVASAAGSVFSLFYAFGFLLFGPLSDRYGRKSVILFGMGMLALTTGGVGVADSFSTVLILRGLQGFFAASFAPTALAFVFDVYPPEKRTTTVGWISFGFVTAGIFGQVLSDIIDQTFDWKIVFFFMAILYAISMAAILARFPSANNTYIGRPQRKNGYFRQVYGVFHNRGLLFCYVITFTLLLTFIGMYTILGEYLQSVHLVEEERMVLIRAAGLVGMVLSPFTGLFVKRFGLLAVLRTGLGMAVVSLVCLGLTGGHINLLVIWSILYVAGISLTFPSIMMLVGEMGGESRAVAAAYYAFILFLGATAGPPIAVTLIKMWGYSGGFLALSGFSTISFIASYFIYQGRAEG
ncbi:MFS transporter [Virgibacillus xinjiangensis]|uniref:MFS transporter n=1 Tax=Virgibacillus xinjiangensis TaxID=393090 RepID=A0ABV7CYQ8_9BACI